MNIKRRENLYMKQDEEDLLSHHIIVRARVCAREISLCVRICIELRTAATRQLEQILAPPQPIL